MCVCVFFKVMVKVRVRVNGRLMYVGMCLFVFCGGRVRVCCFFFTALAAKEAIGGSMFIDRCILFVCVRVLFLKVLVLWLWVFSFFSFFEGIENCSYFLWWDSSPIYLSSVAAAGLLGLSRANSQCNDFFFVLNRTSDRLGLRRRAGLD